MTASHIQLMSIIGAAMTLVAITRPGSSLFWPMLLAGCALLALAYYFNQVEKQRRSKISSVIAQRTAELTRSAWSVDQHLVVPNGIEFSIRIIVLSLLGAAVIGVLLVIIILAAGLDLLFVAPVLIGYFALLAFGPVAKLGRPALILDSSGVQVSGYGVVPWREIDGVSLDVTTNRGHKTFWLLFLVPTIGEGGTRTPWTHRLLANFGIGPLQRKVVRARLTRDPEHPLVVEAVAKHLWKQATGRTDAWNPAMPNEVLVAWRRWQAIHRKSENLAPTVDAAGQAAAEKPERAGALLNRWIEAERELKQAYEELCAAEAAAKRRSVIRGAMMASALGLTCLLVGIIGLIPLVGVSAPVHSETASALKVFGAFSVLGVFFLLIAILVPMWQSRALTTSSAMPASIRRPGATQFADLKRRLERERVDLYTD